MNDTASRRAFYADKSNRRSAYIGRAKWASELLNSITSTGNRIGVEVGLWKADFAQLMLLNNKRLDWYGVDPYFEYGHKHRKQGDWDDTFQRVANKMSEFGDRFTFVRKPSHEGVEFIPDNVHFVFIDGNHDYDFVQKDLLLYEKKVRSGGIMAGHDYYSKEVRRAVDEHVEKFNRHIHVNASFDPCEVFWWVMP